LEAGSRVTLVPGIYHEFYPTSEECIIGEVSTANDDLHDNFFVNPEIGRYPKLEEDEPALIKLVSDKG
jgi:D-lyxose ketol-isomerase